MEGSGDEGNSSEVEMGSNSTSASSREQAYHVGTMSRAAGAVWRMEVTDGEGSPLRWTCEDCQVDWWHDIVRCLQCEVTARPHLVNGRGHPVSAHIDGCNVFDPADAEGAMCVCVGSRAWRTV